MQTGATRHDPGCRRAFQTQKDSDYWTQRTIGRTQRIRFASENGWNCGNVERTQKTCKTRNGGDASSSGKKKRGRRVGAQIKSEKGRQNPRSNPCKTDHKIKSLQNGSLPSQDPSMLVRTIGRTQNAPRSRADHTPTLDVLLQHPRHRADDSVPSHRTP